MSAEERFVLKYFILSFIPILIIIFLVICINMEDTQTPEVVSATELNIPFDPNIPYTITSRFGKRNSPLGTGSEYHKGIDIAIPQGTEIWASGSGYVVSYTVSQLTGETVILEHNLNGQVYRTHYYHMFSGSVVVSEGQSVNAGQKIGIVGMTGSQVTGVHLHFEVRTYDETSKSFTPIDPSYIFG